MDIKKRIQELSLDQKAKLYFMGLVRQGKIDTLPEDPKAAYIKMVMDKDDYGRSISGKDKRTFMEPEDSMPAARARKMAGMESKEDKLKMAYAAYDKAEMNGDIRGQELALAVIDLLKSGELKEMATELGYLKEIGMFHDPLGYQPDTEDNESPSTTDEDLDKLLDIILKYVEDPDDAEAELDRFDQGGFDAMSDYVTANLDRDPEYKAWYNKLHSIKEEEEEDLRLEPEDDEYEDGTEFEDDDLRLEPEDDEYEDGTEFEDDDLRLEPEDMDDPDEDLVIIGSGYLDIKSNFLSTTFPSMTNDELATLGQKVVDKLHKGDKKAALKYIYSQIN